MKVFVVYVVHDAEPVYKAAMPICVYTNEEDAKKRVEREMHDELLEVSEHFHYKAVELYDKYVRTDPYE